MRKLFSLFIGLTLYLSPSIIAEAQSAPKSTLKPSSQQYIAEISCTNLGGSTLPPYICMGDGAKIDFEDGRNYVRFNQQLLASASNSSVPFWAVNKDILRIYMDGRFKLNLSNQYRQDLNIHVIIKRGDSILYRKKLLRGERDYITISDLSYPSSTPGGEANYSYYAIISCGRFSWDDYSPATCSSNDRPSFEIKSGSIYGNFDWREISYVKKPNYITGSWLEYNPKKPFRINLYKNFEIKIRNGRIGDQFFLGVRIYDLKGNIIFQKQARSFETIYAKRPSNK